eukprot:1144202-Prymnesium_polylepis.1
MASMSGVLSPSMLAMSLNVHSPNGRSVSKNWRARADGNRRHSCWRAANACCGYEGSVAWAWRGGG